MISKPFKAFGFSFGTLNVNKRRKKKKTEKNKYGITFSLSATCFNDVHKKCIVRIAPVDYLLPLENRWHSRLLFTFAIFALIGRQGRSSCFEKIVLCFLWCAFKLCDCWWTTICVIKSDNSNLLMSDTTRCKLRQAFFKRRMRSVCTLHIYDLVY